MKTINLSNLLKDYSSGWVAITSDYKKVVATERTLIEVTKTVKKQSHDDVILVSASKNYRGFVTSS